MVIIGYCYKGWVRYNFCIIEGIVRWYFYQYWCNGVQGSIGGYILVYIFILVIDYESYDVGIIFFFVFKIIVISDINWVIVIVYSIGVYGYL